MRIFKENPMAELGGAIGKGLLAGLAATAAMTISQMIEMKINGRKPSNAPVKVAEETLGVKPAPGEKSKMTEEIHFAYGTTWGIARGLISLTGLKGFPATLAHFVAVWGTSMIMLPAFKAAPPITKEDSRSIVIDGLHHAVYATVAGLTYDVLDVRSGHERFFKKVGKFRNLKKLGKELKKKVA